jgi:hypothetical protein
VECTQLGIQLGTQGTSPTGHTVTVEANRHV